MRKATQTKAEQATNIQQAVQAQAIVDADVTTVSEQPKVAKPVTKVTKPVVKATQTTKPTKNVVVAQEEIDLKKSSGRNFYAVKIKNGREVAYAFETVAQRKRWMMKQEEGSAKEITAPDVYRLLQKGRNDLLCANRANRVYVIESKSEVNLEKGQRLVM